MILATISVLAAPPATCPITQTTDFVYYTGSGSSTLSQSWMNHFLTWWKQQDPTVDFQGLSAAQVSACTFQNYPELDMYIQPGGDAYQQQRSIGSTGKAKINSFINNGGAYFGPCAGWYYASPSYYWQDRFYNHANLLGAYPMTIEGSIREVADYDVNPGYTVTSLSNGHRALYWGGPTIGYEYTSNPLGIVDARFNYRDLPAVVKYNNMLLTSVHLEAYENDGFTGLSTSEREENYKYLANLINEVAGTSFYVPAYAQPPVYECSDGLDNDGDTFIDYPLDSDCLSATDNDESTAPPGPITIFSDGFENGLSQWTITGTGVPWTTATTMPYQGSYSAKANKPGVSTPTYMEANIPTGYTTITLSYYRKLVGLDGPDEFSAQYYNGNWITLEATGSSSANDATYQYKEYVLPSTTSKIRYQCMAGAVSESCYVDNVVIIAE